MKDSTPLSSRQISTAVRAMEESIVRSLLQQLSGLNPTVLRQPETGLVMMNVTDCFNSDFHLGEVIVTTAEVSLESKRGFGMVMGDDGDRALLLAILDVLPLTSSDIQINRVIKEIRIWHAKGVNQKNEEQQLAAATRVNFESMTPED